MDQLSQAHVSRSHEQEASPDQRFGGTDERFTDQRSEAIASRKLQEMADASPRTMQLKAYQSMADQANMQQASGVIQLAKYKAGDAIILSDQSRGRVMSVLEDGGDLEVNSVYRAMTDLGETNVLGTQILENVPVSEQHVDAMVGMEAKWGGGIYPSGPPFAEKRKPFYKWLYENGPLPTVMNCWEGILLSAHSIDILQKDQIHALIQRQEVKDPGSPPQLMARIQYTGQVQGNAQTDWSSINIPEGYIIVWGDGLHFALSAGGIHCVQVDGNAPRRSTIAEVTIEAPAYNNKLIRWGRLF